MGGNPQEQEGSPQQREGGNLPLLLGGSLLQGGILSRPVGGSPLDRLVGGSPLGHLAEWGTAQRGIKNPVSVAWVWGVGMVGCVGGEALMCECIHLLCI